MITGKNAGRRTKIWSKMTNFIALWDFETGEIKFLKLNFTQVLADLDYSGGLGASPPTARGPRWRRNRTIFAPYNGSGSIKTALFCFKIVFSTGLVYLNFFKSISRNGTYTDVISNFTKRVYTTPMTRS